jgi:catechol 2,3-dioxygenase-like lactoylglutathione lyase family enzyme
MPPFRLTTIDQVGFVVRDLDRAMEAYWRVGIGPWRVYSYSASRFTEATYRGRPADWSFRLALATVGGFTLELIQPVSGESLYSEYLAVNGEGGIQHLGLVVEDVDLVVEQARQAGYVVVQSGRGHGARGDGKFAYLATADDLRTVYEVMELPSVRIPPDRVYPPEGA